MLIGIHLSDLSLRSKLLLVVATALLAAGVATWLWVPAGPAWPLTLWLLAIVVLGLYWLSFLLDFRGRLARSQALLATAFALLPWVLVLVVVLAFLLLPSSRPAA